MPSKIPKPPITRMASSSPESRGKVTTPYHYVSADYKDFGGFIEELLPTLRKLGVHATWDPSLAGQDSYGIVLSPVPIDPELLAKELIQITIGTEEETEEMEQDYRKDFIPPPALYKRGNKVIMPYPYFRSSKTGIVRTMEYTKRGSEAGWLYTVLGTDGIRYEVFECDLQPTPKKKR